MTLTRSHLVRLGALLLPILGWALGGGAWFCAALVAVLSVIALGVRFPQLQLFGRFVCRGDDARRCVALSFDDGPDAASTPDLLDLLRERNVQVTFFCVGERIEANPELAARIAREGHLLENHSWSHNHATNLFRLDRLEAELSRTQAVIAKMAGVTPRFFRPPMGLSNPRTFAAARALGLTVIGWSARGFDTKLRDPEEIVRRITKQLKPGAIVLLHDGGIPRERLLATVKALLDTVRKLEYEIVRLDRLMR